MPTAGDEDTDKTKCGYFVKTSWDGLQENALRIETFHPSDRCRAKTPKEWNGVDPTARRWLNSGGSPYVLGLCTSNCPVKTGAAEPCTREITTGDRS